MSSSVRIPRSESFQERWRQVVEFAFSCTTRNQSVSPKSIEKRETDKSTSEDNNNVFSTSPPHLTYNFPFDD